MYFFKSLLIFINVINYCSGCLSNTAAAVGPTVTTGAMFTTTTTTTTAATTTTTTVCPNSCGAVPADATVIVGPLTPDANCVYSTTLSCVNPLQMLRFNAAVTVVGSQMTTCNGASYRITVITGTVTVVTVTCV